MFCTKILVAYNESDLAKKALETAAKLARGDESIEIHVLHVTEFQYEPYIVGNVWDLLDESMQKHAEKVLEGAREQLAGVQNPVLTFSERGVASHVILEHAREHGCDLIVMGSRGLTGIREFLGSVSHYVVQHSPVPVLIVK